MGVHKTCARAGHFIFLLLQKGIGWKPWNKRHERNAHAIGEIAVTRETRATAWSISDQDACATLKYEAKPHCHSVIDTVFPLLYFTPAQRLGGLGVLTLVTEGKHQRTS